MPFPWSRRQQLQLGSLLQGWESVIIGMPWVQATAITGATLSLPLTLGYFHRWLAFNILINAAIIFVALG